MSDLPSIGGLPPSRARQLDEICVRFESVWQSGGHPRIEDCLDQVPDAERGVLFRELLAVELAWRARSRDEPPAEEYRDRFPEYAELVDAALAEFPAREPSTPRRRALDTPSLRAKPLHVRCPHCHSPVEFSGAEELSNIQCAVCGSCFSLVCEDETAPFHGRAPERIGNFQLLEEVGMGHFGVVWKARDTELDRLVAVKIPRRGNLDALETEQFFREARAAAQVRHPNIVAVHEVGREGDSIYIVSDFIQGLTLGQWLTDQRVTPTEAARLCLKIAEALHAAHEAGIVHRDLKPGNVMVDLAGEPHITDFGLAKREVAEITMTIEGQVLGTPAYMSPEQARGEGHKADRRSDIYAFGVILYELLTGERPFRGEPRMLIVQVLRDEPISPRKLNSRVPRDIENICLKCLEKDPDRRYQSAHELAEELQRFLRGEPVRARPLGTLSRIWRWYRRHPDATAMVAGGYTTLCAMLLTLWEVEGMLLLALGVDPLPNAGRAMIEMAVIIMGVYLPAMWSGIRALNGRRLGLWIGLALFLLGFTLSICGLLGITEYAAVIAHPSLRLPLLTLLGTLALGGIFVNSVAIFSVYLARQRIDS